jgi:hypothetical protein
MSVDEWVLAGLENPEAAEGSPDPETANSFLVKALHCFEQANDAGLAAKARAHRLGVLFRSQFTQEIAQPQVRND